MIVLGITGGIGSGKGLAAEFFRGQGAMILDADEIARALTHPRSSVLEKIVTTFGPSVLQEDGGLDRRKLAELVFPCPALVEKLNAITHPPILAEVKRRLEEIEKGSPTQEEGRGSAAAARVVCVVAPLLLEAGGRALVDRLLVMAAAKAERMRRVMQRDGLSEEAVRQRMAAQMSPEEQARQADWVVDTTAGRAAAIRQLEMIWAEVRGREAHRTKAICQ